MTLRIMVLGLLCCGGLLANGCAHSTGESIPVDVVFKSDQCRLLEPHSTIIDSHKTLQQTLKTLASEQTPNKALPTVIGGRGEADTLQRVLIRLLDTADLANTQLVVIARGTQPHSGYGISVTGDRAKLQQGRLQLPLILESPDPDKMYTQQVISPCVLLSIATDKAIDTVAPRP